MSICEFAEAVIKKHVILSENETSIWVNSGDVSDIVKLIFFLFERPMLENKPINQQYTIEFKFVHLTETVGVDLSKLPLEKIGVTKKELKYLLSKYDEIEHTGKTEIKP